MSILDYLINILTFLIDNTLGKLPTEYAGFSITQFESSFGTVWSSLLTSFDFIAYFFPIKLIFLLLSTIIIAEILLHFGFKGIKYIINLFRGSGG